MQEVRKCTACWFFMAAVACLAFWSIACNSVQGDDSFIAKVQNADQIVLATPQATIDVKGGETFQVKVDRVLRGKSKPETTLRIVQSGDADKHPKFDARQQYLFFLKNPANPASGWLYFGLETFPIKNGKLTLAEGDQTQDLTVSDLVKLVAETPISNEKLPERKDLTGRWFVVVSRDGSDEWTWLVDIGPVKEGGNRVVKQLAAAAGLPAGTLASANATGNDIQLIFNVEGQKFQFDGSLKNGTIRGSMLAPRIGLVPARMIATESANLEGFDEPRETIGRQDFIDAMGKEKPEALREFISKYPESALTLDAYTSLAGMLATAKVSQDEYEKMAADYQKVATNWGPALQTRVDLDLAVNLLRRGHLPELGLKHLDAAEKRFTDAIPAFLKSLVRKERGRGLLLVGKTADGVALLGEIHKESPFDAEVTYLLAGQAEAAGKSDDAMAMYAEVTALPSLEATIAETLRQRGEKDVKEVLPSTKLKKLWEAKHGNTNGLEKFLGQTADESIRKLAKNPVAPRKPDAGNRVALLELFTGGSCPPCVGADAALTALEATYKPSELIVLRYHAHIPAPDPLANAVNMSRMEQYDAKGTPAIYLNGKNFPLGGPLQLAPMIYSVLRQAVDPILLDKVQPKLNLSAKALPGLVQVTATVTDLNPIPPNLRLLLVVAENRVEFRSDNGIRVHDMLVRAVPSKIEGIAPDKTTGQLTHTFKLSTAGLRKGLTAHLANVEKESEQTFRDKPLDLKDLKLIGFLQDIKTGEVTQAAIIPLPAELPGGAADAGAATKASAPGQ